MPEHIIDLLTLGGRHTRSIALDRDLLDPQAVGGYLVTPNSISALRQIGSGIAAGRAQRAWKIVGPYGSGKSALGIMLAQLASGGIRYPEAAKRLSAISTKVADIFAEMNRFPLAVVGSRVSFGVALAKAIVDSLPRLSKGKAAAASLRKHLDLGAGIYKGRPLNAAVGELSTDFAALIITEGYDGVLLMIDEVGKFVEYAALYPEHGDLIALQQVAEQACKAGDDKLVVVAMLHQHFASYAAGVGRALNDEWHKVAARFEEVPFDEPIERYAHFASNALSVKADLSKLTAIVSDSRLTYAAGIEVGVLRAPTALDKKLFDRAEQLYPLHPLSLAALATVSKRYGQSERSFHAFLMGSEPRGLRDFAERTAPGEGVWYRLTDLYDFLSGGNELRFRELDSERRWVFAQTAVEQFSQDPVATSLLKTIAVLELVRGTLNVRATAENIAWAIGEDAVAQVEEALVKLADQGLLVRRRKRAEFGLAVSEAVNVEALYESAARTNESELIVGGISKALSQRLIVANRHYDVTGTIRTIGLLVGTPDLWPQPPVLKSDDVRPDAWLKLVLVTKGSAQEDQSALRLQREDGQLSIGACLALSSDGRAALAEYAIWQAVLLEVNNKQLDPWTSRYVEGRLQEASETVERLVTSALAPAEGREGPSYWYKGEKIPASELMNASQLASWLFDRVFHKAPVIINELINKDRPTSAIVLGRQRMFDVLLSGDPTQKICADNEFPPERLIHASLLKQTGIWSETNGRWTLQAPHSGGENEISSVWSEISCQLGRSESSTFGEVLDALAAPPFGVRAGPAGIWIALYLLVNRSRCAIFERGTLVLELTAEHLQRMFKNPQAFAVREFVDEDSGRRLIADYRKVLAAIGCAVEADATYLDLTRILIRWFSKLPDFTRQTVRIGKDAAIVRSVINKATDPIALLTQSLRRAHLESKSKLEFAAWLTNALSDLGMAYRRLQDDVAAELSRGFGITGPLSRIRTQLQNECTREASRLADVNLKSFILRCTDLVLSDEKWLDSVGSLIAHRQLDSWQDDTLSKFQEGLGDLCSRYHRWMQLVMRRGEAPRAADRFVGLTLTMPGGEEKSIFVSTNDASAKIAKDILLVISNSTDGNDELAAAVLAQALLELQSRVSAKDEEEVKNG